MIEYIGNVKMNYNFYNGQDSYSDGEIEDELLKVLLDQKDISQLLQEDNRWPTLYHFSPNRHNLLEWFSFKPESDVLEIGSGCGAITGLLCEKSKSVTCIELSKKRSLINAHRHLEKSNLEIIVGNLNEIKLEKKYDYVTLIGVLEYAALYTETESPYISFLENARKYIKEGGVLIIAIENKLGLKYWAGSREDHTGQFFDGLQNYPSKRKVATFSNLELEALVREAGYKDAQFYYPYPDYKMPTQIYSDNRLPVVGELKGNSPNYDQNRVLLFDEESVMDNLIRNQLFPTFSNSFLVFCSN
ncbi:class I SAM-dependent methyltransferase [Paenibacillus sp. P96]|uniref:Class I SAM-dependent methyltransferase n=1 Tax=Paenibacillus zeirhizosphaerae TaxID=2987519 RepID=A0ABT9FP51_9BACL|nr:class I SAM-dependent methyltransferase [Paenibacillus sp. P96]MDP4096509.1 class I SAM-dependent methyltransferase [Paenibacillus sp. P96]